MKKIIIVLLAFLLLGVFVLNVTKKPSNVRVSDRSVQVNNIQPQKLTINKIGVSAVIESVGLDSMGRMDVPRKVEDVAWYNLGPKPGQVGSSVIAGHLDTQTGSPAVFWNLSKLNPGDNIEISDEQGKVLRFIVTKKQVYDYDKFPLSEVFGDTSGKLLNLITCQGTFDKKANNYSQRTVVFSKLEGS